MKNLHFANLCFMFGLTLSGWMQSRLAADEVVASSANAVTYTAAAQHAVISTDGMLRGQVHSLAPGAPGVVAAMQVNMIGPAGGQVAVVTDAQGMFAVPNQGAGIYRLSGRSPGAVLSQAILVHASSEASVAPLHLFAFNQYNDQIERALSAHVSAGLESNGAASSSDLQSLPDSRGPANGRVQLTPTGRMLGQLWSLQPNLTGTAITIYQNDMVVARAQANAQGEFELPLAPGTYGLLASGPAGHAAFGFEAVAAPTGFSALDVPSNVRYIALAAAQVPPQLGFGLSDQPLPPPPPPGLIVPPPPVVNDVGPPIGPPPGGFVGGGGGFGGGGGGLGGGGGGGMGAALGIGGLAVGIVALSTDDDDNLVVSPSGQ